MADEEQTSAIPEEETMDVEQSTSVTNNMSNSDTSKKQQKQESTKEKPKSAEEKLKAGEFFNNFFFSTLSRYLILRKISGFVDLEQMKEKYSKLLLGEDMSGGGKGVSSALALSNAITNLAGKFTSLQMEARSIH